MKIATNIHQLLKRFLRSKVKGQCHSKMEGTSPAEGYPLISNCLPIFRLVEACRIADQQFGKEAPLFTVCS